MTPGTARSIDDFLGSRVHDVMVDGARYAVHTVAPDGPAASQPPAVLLHGVPETSACWRDLVPALAVDGAVHAVDLKGMGDSQADGPFDVGLLVRELVAVCEELGRGGPVDLVGHDWGGSLAAAVAAARPDLVRRLVVVAAPYRSVSYVHAPHIPFFALPALPERVIAARGDRFVDDLFRMAWRSGTLPDDVREHYRTALAAPERVEAVLGYYRSSVRGRLRRAQRSASRALAAAPGRVSGAAARRGVGSRRDDMFAAATASASTGAATGREPRIHCERHLVLWGAADPVMPIGVGEAVCREMRDPFTMVTLPGVGHWPVEEAPAVAVGEIAGFLRIA